MENDRNAVGVGDVAYHFVVEAFGVAAFKRIACRRKFDCNHKGVFAGSDEIVGN